MNFQPDSGLDCRGSGERVRRMMRDNGIQARGKKKYKLTTDSNHALCHRDRSMNIP